MSICLLDMTMSCATTAEPMEVLLDLLTWMGHGTMCASEVTTLWHYSNVSLLCGRWGLDPSGEGLVRLFINYYNVYGVNSVNI